MGEPQKGTSSANPKEKKSFLDEDIGKDFLSSWKSMSVAEDGAIDFGFNTASSGKKNAFNFGKLDMDFNLDGDFDKLSSFKVDMSDFDFSAPLKKAANPKEISKSESSTGNPQGKKDDFSFSFDFSELDGFNFDSSLAKEEKASSKNQDDKMEISSDGSEHQGSKLQLDAMATKLPAPEEVATSNRETLLGGPGPLNSSKKDQAKYVPSGAPILSNSARSSPEKAMRNNTEAVDQKIHVSEKEISEDLYTPATVLARKLPASEEVATSNRETLLSGPGPLNSNKKDQAKYASSGAPVLSNSARSSPEKATRNSTEAIDKKIHVFEKEISKELYTPATVLDFASQSLNGIDSSRDTFTDGMIESCQQNTGIYPTSSQREDVNEIMVAGVLSYHEDLPLKSSSAVNLTTSGNNKGRENKSGSGISTENVDGDELVEGDLELEEKSTSSILKKAPHRTKNNKENCGSRAELLVAHPCSETEVDKVTLTNENEAGGLHSKFSKMEGTTTSLSSVIERPGPSHKSPENETKEDSRSKDTQTGTELHRNPTSVAKELPKVEDVLLIGEKNIKNLNNIREGFTSDGLPNGGKLVGKSRLHGEEATRRIPIIPASDMNVKDQNTLSPQVSPSSSLGKQCKFSPHTCANSKLFVPSMEYVQDITSKPIEGNRHSLVRAGKKMPNLATMKIFKAREAADKVPSDSSPQKDTSSLQKTEQNMDVEGSSASETSHPFSSNEKKSSMNLSLKRKTLEFSNSDLSCSKPLKRLSESLTKSRDFKEPLKRIEEKFSTVGKSMKPLKCLSEAVTESRDVKEPLKRTDIKDSLKRIDQEKVCIDKNQVESKTESALYNFAAAASPQWVNMMEFEISSVMENDGNVEKAEAYAKELEDICNMLKKKHEEAKEILVRAIVNNNNLLMLNHPIYEEKICKVQKIAAELIPKELKV